MSGSGGVTWGDYARALGVNINRARVDAQLTQERLAAAAGITRTHLQQIERGVWRGDRVANPSIKVLASIAVVLEVEVASLLPGTLGLRLDDD